MDDFQSTVDLVAKGGIIMIPIIALSLYSIYIIILKSIAFADIGALNETYHRKGLLLIHEKKYHEAAKYLERSKSPTSKILQAAAKLAEFKRVTRKELESEIERIGTNEIKKMETHVKGLEMTYGVAPLLGLLGTVIGMVDAFAKIAASASRVDTAVLAGGIWEALITTVGGLVVAVPAFIAYYAIDGYLDNVRANMKDYAIQVINIIRGEQTKNSKKAGKISDEW